MPPGPYYQPTPTGRVTNKYGGTQYRAPGGPERLPPYNKGTDFGSKLGDPVTAVVDGTVQAVYHAQSDNDRRENSGWGGSVVILGADGNTYRYSHLQRGSIGVKVGDRVTGGQSFARVGETGNAIGPHVDLEAYDPQGRDFDVAQLLGGAQVASDSPGLNEPGGPIGPPGPPPAGRDRLPSYADIPPQKRHTVDAALRARERSEQAIALHQQQVQRAKDALDAAIAGAVPGMDNMRVQALRDALNDAQAELNRAELQLREDERKLGEALDATPPKGDDPAGTKRQTVEGGYAISWIADGQGNWSLDPSTPPTPYLPSATKGERPGTHVSDLGDQIVLYDDTGKVIQAFGKSAGLQWLQTEQAILGVDRGGNVVARIPKEQAPDTVTANNKLYVLDPRTKEIVSTTDLLSPEERKAARYKDRVENGRLVVYDPASGLVVNTVDLVPPEERRLEQAPAELTLTKLKLLQEASAAFEAAYAMPEGPERRAALQSALERYAALTDPAAALSYANATAAQQFQKAQELSKQTGQVIDPFTLQPKLDASGQPQLTAEEQHRRRVAEETARSNRAAEAARQQQNATAALEGYARSGVATAPFQAGVVGALAPLTGLERAAQAVGLPANHPIVQGIAQAMREREAANQPADQPSPQLAGVGAQTGVGGVQPLQPAASGFLPQRPGEPLRPAQGLDPNRPPLEYGPQPPAPDPNRSQSEQLSAQLRMRSTPSPVAPVVAPLEEVPLHRLIREYEVPSGSMIPF